MDKKGVHYMFGLFKKILPHATDRKLNETECLEAEAFIRRVHEGTFSVSEEVAAFNDRQIMMLYLVTVYSMENGGRMLGPMTRGGVMGILRQHHEEMMASDSTKDIPQMRINMVKAYDQMIQNDLSCDLKGLFFDIRFKYVI
jgi:hypothetical protein